MPKKPVVKVIQDDKPVPVEVLAKDILAIAQGVRALRKGPLKDATLVLLIQNAIPRAYRPALQDIQAVLDGIESLEAVHLKPAKVRG